PARAVVTVAVALPRIGTPRARLSSVWSLGMRLARTWLLQAYPWRAFAEVALSACLLTLPLAIVLRPILAAQAASVADLPDPLAAFGEGKWHAHGIELVLIGLVHIGLLSGPVGAFRLRRFGPPCQPELRRELAGLGG